MIILLGYNIQFIKPLLLTIVYMQVKIFYVKTPVNLKSSSFPFVSNKKRRARISHGEKEQSNTIYVKKANCYNSNSPINLTIVFISYI
jgi:hypothetical protein